MENVKQPPEMNQTETSPGEPGQIVQRDEYGRLVWCEEPTKTDIESLRSAPNSFTNRLNFVEIEVAELKARFTGFSPDETKFYHRRISELEVCIEQIRNDIGKLAIPEQYLEHIHPQVDQKLESIEARLILTESKPYTASELILVREDFEEVKKIYGQRLNMHREEIDDIKKEIQEIRTLLDHSHPELWHSRSAIHKNVEDLQAAYRDTMLRIATLENQTRILTKEITRLTVWLKDNKSEK